MAKSFDFKREYLDLYAPTGMGSFWVVNVPEFTFLAIDGEGDPDASPAYRAAIETLYTTAYAVRAAAKHQLGLLHTVAPLEGLWYTDDPGTLIRREKTDWRWTLMIAQPPYLDLKFIKRAVASVKESDAPQIATVRVTSYAEGISVQVMHAGSFDDQGPVLDDLYNRYMTEHGLDANGPYHEIYLSQARRRLPETLRIVLRQPVRKHIWPESSRQRKRAKPKPVPPFS